MTADPATRPHADSGRSGMRPLLDVMAVLAAQQQQLDDLTDALETQHRTQLRLLEHLSPPTTNRPPDAHVVAAGQQP